jgi:hypothetical protein
VAVAAGLKNGTGTFSTPENTPENVAATFSDWTGRATGGTLSDPRILFGDPHSPRPSHRRVRRVGRGTRFRGPLTRVGRRAPISGTVDSLDGRHVGGTRHTPPAGGTKFFNYLSIPAS